jgi:DUF971 family protein/molybdopterin converting factor small subunit
MTTDQIPPISPTGISLHQKSRLLEITFSDAFRFNYPYEYLRVFSSGVQGLDKPVHGKDSVDITHIEPQGTEALQLEFSDGYTGSYAWSVLHQLGVNYEQNWQAYLDALRAQDLTRGAGRPAGGDGRVIIKLLYFIQLATLAGKDGEEIQIPESVSNVQTLLAWLRKRGPEWAEACADDEVQVTVNKHFAEPFTLIEHGDEVAIVPRGK